MEFSFDMILGAGMIIFGLYTLVARQVAPEKFAKLEPMKKTWGPKAGFAVHFIGYTLLPIVAGTVMFISSFSS